MKKIILLFLIILSSNLYSQYYDKIYHKNGHIETVYKIKEVSDGSLRYFKTHTSNEIKIDTVLIKGYQTIWNETYNKSKIEERRFDNNAGQIKYNLGKFYKQMKISHVMYGAAIFSTIVGGISKSEPLTYIGGGLGLIGFGIYIDSYKWINKASIESSLNGISLKVTF